MTEVTERAAAESHAAAVAATSNASSALSSQQQQAAGDVDGETRHRQQMNSALAALPRKDSEEEYDYIDNGYSTGAPAASSYDRYRYSATSYTNAPVTTSTALTLYDGDDDDDVEGPAYAHLFDSPADDDDDAYGPANKTSASSTAYYTQYKSQQPVVKNPFTGLSNQGATCYMNSLLQTMFMTPEFRKGLYEYTLPHHRNGSIDAADDATDDTTDDSSDDNIPFQLQKLFAKLQVSPHASISTKALTKSFGWTGADVFQQHDVQELCRVLFDAIETSFKGTNNETLVNDLYQGALNDYVQCHVCKHESARIDHFLDLSLVIRPFGSDVMMQSVEDALELFLRPELLSGDNQWHCDKCGTKRDAIKGLKFAKLPYLLSLQLKRFDFDYATMNRIKLHNRVTFPKFLDMNAYVQSDHSDADNSVDAQGSNGSGSGKRGGGTIARKMSIERHELEATAGAVQAQATETTDASRSDARRLSSMDETHALQFPTVDSGVRALDSVDLTTAAAAAVSTDDAIDTWRSTFDPLALIQRNGPHVYELYSVLIHSGSALGGHYYAYIKSFESGKWFNFNDSHVSAISDDELQTAFGGSGNASSSSYSTRMSYSTCAYMLMYRLVSPAKNVNAIPASSIPSYLSARFAADDAKAQAAELERIEMTKKVFVRFFMKGTKPKNVEKAMHLYKTSTIAEALKAGVAAFASDKATAADIVIPTKLTNIRLRGYNDYTSMLADTFDGREDVTLSELSVFTGQQLFLEVKSDDEAWTPYDPFKLQFFVRRFVDPEVAKPNGDNLLARCLQVDDNATLGTLCAVIADKFHVAPGVHIRLLTKSGYGTAPVKILTTSNDPAVMNLRLRMNLHITNGTEIYMEETLDLTAPSPAKAFFEREANTVVVNYKYESRPAAPVRIDRRETVRVLKAKIATALGLQPETFKLLRGVNASGIEIKTLDSTLYSLSISANHTLFVLDGVPLEQGEYNFKLLLYRPNNGATVAAPTAPPAPAALTVVSTGAGSNDDDNDAIDRLLDADEVVVTSNKDDASFVAVGPIIVSENMPVDAIRARVFALLTAKQLLPLDRQDALTPAHIRLRDMRQNTMTQILVDGRKLQDASDAAVYEGRGLVAQILPTPETATADHRLVEFVYVDRAKWRFHKTRRLEAIISKTQQLEAPLTYLADVASAAFTIPPERLRFARIPYHRDSCDVLEVVTYAFYTSEELLRARTPDYQELVLVTDATAPVEFLTHRERMAIQKFLAKRSADAASATRAKYGSSVNTSGGYHYSKPKEAALVIRTKSRTSDKDKKTTPTSGNGKNSSSPPSSSSASHDTAKTAAHAATNDTRPIEDGVTIRVAPSAAAARATTAAGSDTDDSHDDVLADLDLLDIARDVDDDDSPEL